MHILFPLAPIEARSMPAVARGYQCSYGSFSEWSTTASVSESTPMRNYYVAKGSFIFRGENGEIVFTKGVLIVSGFYKKVDK